jgi:hypothetical protein
MIVKNFIKKSRNEIFIKNISIEINLNKKIVSKLEVHDFEFQKIIFEGQEKSLNLKLGDLK